uniref:Uncharacterized protein n=1 Tax=Cacopsylla melanoneura TaxID=428564 RepID=A0A8D8RQH6_9HEMI
MRVVKLSLNKIPHQKRIHLSTPPVVSGTFSLHDVQCDRLLHNCLRCARSSLSNMSYLHHAPRVSWMSYSPRVSWLHHAPQVHHLSNLPRVYHSHYSARVYSSSLFPLLSLLI